MAESSQKHNLHAVGGEAPAVEQVQCHAPAAVHTLRVEDLLSLVKDLVRTRLDWQKSWIGVVLLASRRHG